MRFFRPRRLCASQQERILIAGLTVWALFAAAQRFPESNTTRSSSFASAPQGPTRKVAKMLASGETTPGDKALFTDLSEQAGIRFQHFNGMSGEHYYAEIVGSGAALFDFDNDGDLDIFFVQGNMLGSGKTLADALTPPPAPLPLRSRLYRNDLTSDSGRPPSLHFTDVTDRSGIDAQGYGMGVATGDFDNDGWVDLYVTNFSSNQLWRNQGDGTFRDVTRKAGVDDTRWSISAAFLDFDRDGWLDLYVANYVEFDFKNRKQCYSHAEAGYYCGPMSYEPVPERLFRNRGDGTFEDVSEKSGIAGEYNGALGVSCADFNGDG